MTGLCHIDKALRGQRLQAQHDPAAGPSRHAPDSERIGVFAHSPSSSLLSLGARCGIGLAQSFQGLDETEPADESLFGAVLHAKEPSDRLAPELKLELDGQLQLPAFGGRVVHRNRRYSGAPICRLGALPEVLP
jgi:hypothetical protein